ncbi:hypothetical protein D3C78_534600 [compost metagenome]
MVLAANRVDGDQFAIALILQACLIAIGLGLGQGGAGAVIVGLERSRVDFEQDIALFDIAAFTVHPLEHDPGHAGTDFGSSRGENAAIELSADGQRLDGYGFDTDAAGRRFFFIDGAVIAGAQRQHSDKQWH